MGFNARFNVSVGIAVFASPAYSYKTKIYFEDANTPGLDQNGFGILYFTGGIELTGLKLILSVWANNLLNQRFIVSAGNAGSLFGDPTQIPGAPRMFGTRIKWRF